MLSVKCRVHENIPPRKRQKPDKKVQKLAQGQSGGQGKPRTDTAISLICEFSGKGLLHVDQAFESIENLYYSEEFFLSLELIHHQITYSL